MCTLMTLDRNIYKNNEAAVIQRIKDDAWTNADGVSLLLLHANGEVSNFRAMSVAHAQTLLDALEWTRFWLHQRAATTRNVATEFTHGFCQDGVWYMHNGVIRGAEADRLPVDSMVIGRWLSRNQHYERLAKESFANVFFVAPEQNVYTVWRSTGGSLFTDGQGNYSTRVCGPISIPATLGGESFYLRDPAELERERVARLEAEREERVARYARWSKRAAANDTVPGDGMGSLWAKYGLD